jgi:predicted secreted Zn-dependent protease
LPRWTGPTNAFQTIQPTWDRYFAALAEHEAGHARFALDAAAEMHKQVQALGEQPDCEGLKKKINALAQQVLADYRKREQQYDQTTRHGATQGAVFPGRPRGPRPWEEPRSR